MLTPNRASAVPASVVLPTTRRPYAAAFRGMIALAAATGLIIECLYGNVLVVLSFFTIWSNILVALVLAWGAVRAWTRRPPLPAVWTGGVVLCITVVGLVFHLVLDNPASEFNQAAEIARLTGAKAVANQLLHTVTPIGTALDFLLLTAPGALRPPRRPVAGDPGPLPRLRADPRRPALPRRPDPLHVPLPRRHRPRLRRLSSRTRSSSARPSTRWASPSSAWTASDLRRDPRKPDFVSARAWAKVIDVAAT